MGQHVMPWRFGYLLASPLRRLTDSPEKIIGPHIQRGMTVLDVGCAMGFFTLPMARMVGEDGHVVAVDLQPQMLVALTKRLRRARLSDRVDLRRSGEISLGIGDLPGQVDFTLAVAVLHETGSKASMLEQISVSMRNGARLLIIEPPSHVSDANWRETEKFALETGFIVVDRPMVRGRNDRSILLEKPIPQQMRA